MDHSLELFVLTWGVYPRRILLYLAEKGLLSSPIIKITSVDITENGLSAPGKPPGSVPILRLPNGQFIKQSVAILEYLEDICGNPDPEQTWQVELAKNARDTGSMRGDTPEERSRIRDMLSLADEATSLFSFACHKGTVLFVSMEATNALSAKFALELCKKNLKLLEEYYAEEGRFGSRGRVSIADCLLYSLLHFAKDLYGVDLLSDPELPSMRRFYELFGKRESAKVEADHFPGHIKRLASQWLPVE
ncbi:glutathione S-transferase family protein [Aspergillus alliaceus]|uniref:glutathione S-transferase family protein n=1 Tax=Petromyces alliaceus TaxID=209559 RepID=UPI0012A3BFFB|nr:uncharacterized protein BDW43DRAFT_312386 [Aspergillus alliaceus]KAB8232062.1 hypothetical protein BDW43DRAFT_312386 [Aspergillus alliaceus]